MLLLGSGYHRSGEREDVYPYIKGLDAAGRLSSPWIAVKVINHYGDEVLKVYEVQFQLPISARDLRGISVVSRT
ncbi:MAG: hypothetical protein H0U16_05190 [Actinobacteria bacterium]|nr:hypothetical protein [Actinomycetota bacterium]